MAGPSESAEPWLSPALRTRALKESNAVAAKFSSTVMACGSQRGSLLLSCACDVISLGEAGKYCHGLMEEAFPCAPAAQIS